MVTPITVTELPSFFPDANVFQRTLSDSKQAVMLVFIEFIWTLPDMLGMFGGGERGIRTLDTLPYTHFPGVRLRPLGHLSCLDILFVTKKDAKG